MTQSSTDRGCRGLVAGATVVVVSLVVLFGIALGLNKFYGGGVANSENSLPNNPVNSPTPKPKVLPNRTTNSVPPSPQPYSNSDEPVRGAW